ncbi:hypothetical protein C8Q76DRAFT_733070 [Earliella scabrosa]|nr:hypothetical protein C8Q76DRAFT_733070 [Earliella scabrosa]
MSLYEFRNLWLCLVPCSWSWDMLDATSSTQIPDDFKLSNPKAPLDLHGPFDPASSGSTELHGEELWCCLITTTLEASLECTLLGPSRSSSSTSRGRNVSRTWGRG